MQRKIYPPWRNTTLLGVALNECIFVGDGGSNELERAHMVGMKAIQAKWYTNQHPNKRESMAGFLTAEDPLDILQYIAWKNFIYV